MSRLKMKPCPECGNADVAMYGYGDWAPLTWYVECDGCLYRGPGGNKSQAVKGHNDLAAAPLEICPQCNGSGVGVADTTCTRCNGTGGILAALNAPTGAVEKGEAK